MHILIAAINNAYAARHECVYVRFSSQCLVILQILMKKNLISFYTIVTLQSIKHFYIKLNYFKGRPMFFLTLLAKNSNPRYLKKSSIKCFYRRENSAYTYLSTSQGWYTSEKLVSLQWGGKLMVTIHIMDKNLDG